MRNYRLLFLSLLISHAAFGSVALSQSGMVVSEEKYASQIGANILKAGGNAIDAAVAVGYALAVTDPCCGNIGGGGFMTIHLATGKNVFINFREKAPFAASKNMYSGANKDQTTKGYLAVAVPGTVLGLDVALTQYGTMSRTSVMQGAIDLAENGIKITPYEAARYAKFAKDFRQDPTVAAIFLKNNQPLQAGDILKQPDLAKTLSLIAKEGPAVFYRGSIAKAIVADSQQHGGILTLNDFANYTVKFSQPLMCQYPGYTILSAPPPSSGGVTLCEILGILQHFNLKQLGYRTPQSVRVIVEAMRDGFNDRNQKLGDPDFVKNPVQQLISAKYTKKLSQNIRKEVYAPHVKSFKQKELTDTTHYSIVDQYGNAVSVTYTLNGFFGAEVIANHTGFFLNDEMDDFATHPGQPNKFGLVQADANTIQPGKRPLSSMAPTIVLKNHQAFMVLGSPGGPRIITAVLLTLINYFDYGLNLENAINESRFHFQGDPNVIDIEAFAFSPRTIRTLNAWGYPLMQQDHWGAVAGVLIDRGNLVGVMDIRRPDGLAVGV